jgi:UDP-N-acetyl-D-galactosamine dehydrogenase
LGYISKKVNKEEQAIKIGIIGLGYVGLPLAVEFAKLYRVVGFDINNQRIEELKGNNDQTQEADLEILKAEIANKQLTLTSNLNELKECNY